MGRNGPLWIGKKEAVCEGWNHDRSIAAAVLLATGIQQFFSVEGLVRYRFDMQSTYDCVGLCQFMKPPKKYGLTTPYTAMGSKSYPERKSRPTELSRLASHSLKILEREARGGGRTFSEGAL